MSTAGERKAGYPLSAQGQVPAGYGFTHAQLEQERKDQKAGKQTMVKAIPGRKDQDPDDPYMVPRVEFLNHFHVESELPHHLPNGERVDRGKTVQIFHEAAYAQQLKLNMFRNKKVEVIHDPTMAQEWLALQNESGSNERQTPPDTKEPIKINTSGAENDIILKGDEVKAEDIEVLLRAELVKMALKNDLTQEKCDVLKVPELKDYLIKKLITKE